MVAFKINADIFGGDIAILVEIASTTASQLNELERLVSNAEKYTEKMDKYNQIAMDHYFRAQRVILISNDLLESKEHSIEDLGSLNNAIRRLKSSMLSLKDNVRDFKKDQRFYNDSETNIQELRNSMKKDEKLVNMQLNRSGQSKSSAGARNQIAQNTALANKQLLDLKYINTKNLETNNKILRQHNESKRNEIIKNVETKRMMVGDK